MTRLRRLYSRYRKDGLSGVASALIRRLQRKQRDQRPPRWARFGAPSLWLANRVPLLQPPVVILSLPRSGSSWVGSLVGCAPNAAY